MILDIAAKIEAHDHLESKCKGNMYICYTYKTILQII